MFAAAAQVNRRNLSKEAQCISILQALRNVGEEFTREELAERYGISTATFGRASQVLNRGIESEIVAACEGTVSLMKTLEEIKKREKAEDEVTDDGGVSRAKVPERKDKPADVEAMLGSILDRQDRHPDELSEALHELQDRIGGLSDNVHMLGLKVEDPKLIFVELRNVCEELEQVALAIAEAYPPGQVVDIYIDGEPLSGDQPADGERRGRALPPGQAGGRVLHAVERQARPQAQGPRRVVLGMRRRAGRHGQGKRTTDGRGESMTTLPLGGACPNEPAEDPISEDAYDSFIAAMALPHRSGRRAAPRGHRGDG